MTTLTRKALIGPYDGSLATYSFGAYHATAEVRQISARTLAQAILLFRESTLCPERHATREGLIPVDILVADPNGEGGRRTFTTARGTRARWERVAQIPIEDPETAITAAQLATLPAVIGDGTPRAEIAPRYAVLEAQKRELERQMRELNARMEQAKRELERWAENLGFLSAYLGVGVRPFVLREGSPAPADTPITVRQTVLCMDEEIAVHDLLTGRPVRADKGFTARDIDRFCAWLTDTPEALATVFPWPKGICALRPRREPLHREAADLFAAMANAHEAAEDAKTYLLVRNGQQLTLIAMDADVWPRLIPADVDAPTGGEADDLRDRAAQRDTLARAKAQLRGLLTIQGLIAHTDVLCPLPAPRPDVLDPSSAGAFNLVRDAENSGLLVDTAAAPLHTLTWNGYLKWLQEQNDVGCSVLYVGPTHDRRDGINIEARTGRRHLSWPAFGEVCEVVEATPHEGRTYGTAGRLLYSPREPVYRRDEDGYMEPGERQRRCGFAFYSDEVVPLHALSWRVLEHFLRDRQARPQYMYAFPIIQAAYRWAKATAAAERPFVDLVLKEAGVDPFDPTSAAARTRAERILRWWKFKVRVHRTVTSDEAKALRMVSAAFARGEDPEDPERALVDAATSAAP